MFGTTLRAAPATADSPGHRFLLRAGYVRQLGQGIYSYLPLAWRTIRKIETVLREEMDAIGGQELLMPVVHPADVWKRSGRYHAIGPELARFRDRRDRDLVLAMTHEEVVATLAASEVTSYTQLPRLIYHIQTKFRDDPRPRAGLIRVREFDMKDAYSLDLDEAGLDAQYRAVHAAYFHIFARVGLPVVAVGADVGAMGGNMAHEFMYVTPVGEDTLVFCDGCGYAQNRQVASFRKGAGPAAPVAPIEKVHTPGATTIDALAAFLSIPATGTAKALLMTAERQDADGEMVAEPVLAVIRGDLEVNETKLANAVGAVGKGTALRPMTEDEARAVGLVPGYASPVGIAGVTVVVDDSVGDATNLVAGANEPGYHLLNTNVPRDYEPAVVTDIAAARDGDACVRCGHPLRTARGVEVGNIFKLGTRYAGLGSVYVDSEGQERPIVMGSYGIGVERLLACIAEEHCDERGLRLPVTVAPYEVHVTALPSADAQVAEAAERLYADMSAAGIEVIYDDRGERPGVQFADADLIGVPLRVTVSERTMRQGGVEIKARAGDVADPIVPVETAVSYLQDRLRALYEAVATGPNPHQELQIS